MKHLQADIWQQLCAGQLDTEQARYWANHLESGCETCESLIAAFAQQGETDPLDGFVDEALLSNELAKNQPKPQLDQLGFARLQKTLQKRRWSRRLAGLGSLAALVAGLVIFWPGLFHQQKSVQTWHNKGINTVLSGELQILQVKEQNLKLITDNNPVVVGDSLVFHFSLQQDACVQLVMQRDAKDQALLDNFKCLNAGQHSLESQGQVLAYQLEKAGQISFYLQLKDAQGAQGESPHIQLRVGEKARDRLP